MHIQSISNVVDFGIAVNSNLKYSLYINNVSSKDNKRAN